MTGPHEENKIAIVIPWFGRSQKGGAEQQAWNLAVRLSGRGYAVEVLTTCCQSFHDDWSVNHLAPGLVTEPEGFATRRFPVEPRDRAAFDRVCGYLLSLPASAFKPGVSPISDEDEQIFREHLIRCPALLAYLRDEGWRYAAFVFIPYLYGPILDGLPLVASRALLQPCLHDESYAYMRCVQRAFFAAKHILWNSVGEQSLGLRLYGPGIGPKSVVVGEGIDNIPPPSETPDTADLSKLRPFVLALGRKDPGKGTLHAVDAFCAYKQRNGTSSLQLVIAGPGEMDLSDPTARIHDLSIVSERVRAWLLRHATALLQPSPNESFSRVLFESWFCARPVVARRTCLATAQAVLACGGGWLAEGVDEWSEVLGRLETMGAAALDEAGRRGQAYAADIADWSRVMDRYDAILDPLLRQPEVPMAIRLTLVSNRPQRVRILHNSREITVCDLQPGQVSQTDWLESTFKGTEPALQFCSDTPASHYPPDPRLLGFRIQDLEVRHNGSRPGAWEPRFARGWNRSEGAAGQATPRWSTGNAEIVLQRNQVPDGKARVIHQVLPNLAYGDAIGNHTIWIRDQLQSLGYDSEIYARHIAPNMLHQVLPYDGPQAVPADAAIIYHHSIGSEITPWVCGHAGPKALIYHNITPARFFEAYRPEFAEILRKGREELPQLARHFPISVGVSRFNATELAEAGFVQPGVLPLCIDPAHWAFPPDEQLMASLQDGRTNVLFVGRVVPNKRFEDLIYTFKFWLEDDPTARLFLVGTAEVASLYLECLQELARRLRVDHAVHFVGQVDDRQLHAYYRCASMFWCFSEHEGFCVPLIEACAFEVPVVARRAGAVPETLGDAGLLLRDRMSPIETARWIAENRLRHLTKLRERARTYNKQNVTTELQQLITKLTT